MRSMKLVSVFVLLALLFSAGPGAVLAQKPPIVDSVTMGHFLVRPEDVATFGEVNVTIPVSPLERGAPGWEDWEDARTTTISVRSPKAGEYVASITSSSYKFSSPQAAQAALVALPDPREDFPGTLLDGTSLLDDRLAQSLDARSATWHAWYGVDDEGLLNYIFSLQTDSYVAGLHIVIFAATVAEDLPSEPSASYEEQVREYIEALTSRMDEGMTFEQLVDVERAHAVGQRLLNHVVERLIGEGKAE